MSKKNKDIMLDKTKEYYENTMKKRCYIKHIKRTYKRINTRTYKGTYRR